MHKFFVYRVRRDETSDVPTRKEYEVGISPTPRDYIIIIIFFFLMLGSLDFFSYQCFKRYNTYGIVGTNYDTS